MGTILHVHERAGGAVYDVYDDAGSLIAQVRRNAMTTDDFELELDRPHAETIRRWITSREGLGFDGALRAEELIKQYYPENEVRLEIEPVLPGDETTWH